MQLATIRHVVAAIRQTYHPNAYLKHVKPVKAGLAARTKILNTLDKQPISAPSIAKHSSISYKAARYHLLLLEAEGTVCRKGKKPSIWLSTGMGQKRLGN